MLSTCSVQHPSTPALLAQLAKPRQPRQICCTAAPFAKATAAPDVQSAGKLPVADKGALLSIHNDSDVQQQPRTAGQSLDTARQRPQKPIRRPSPPDTVNGNSSETIDLANASPRTAAASKPVLNAQSPRWSTSRRPNPSDQPAGLSPTEAVQQLQQAAKQGRLPMKGPQSVDAVRQKLQYLQGQVGQLSIKGMAVTSWAAGKLKRRAQTSEMRRDCSNMMDVLVADLLKRLIGSRATLARVFAPLSPSELCMLLLGFSWSNASVPEKVLDEVAGAAVERIEDFNAQGYANLLWAFFTKRHNALEGELVRAVGRAMEQKDDYSGYSSQAICNLMTVSAWPGQPSLPLQVLDGLAQQALNSLDEFRPQSVATLLQTVSLSEEQSLLLRRLAEECTRRMAESPSLVKDLRVKELAATLIALDRLTDADVSGRNAEVILQRVEERLEEASCMELSGFIKTCSLEGAAPFGNRVPPPLLRATLRLHELVERGQCQLTQGQLCDVLCTCTTLGLHVPHDVLDKFAASFQQGMDSFTPATYARVAWAFAKQRYDPLQGQLLESLYQALLQQQAEQVPLFGEQDLSQLMWAASHLDHAPPPQLMDNLAAVALDRLDDFSDTTAQAFALTFANLGYKPLEGKLARYISIKIHTRTAGRTESS